MPMHFEKPTLTAGADNASGTHRPSHYTRGVCAARDRLRAEGDVAMAGWPARTDRVGGGRSAPAGSAGDRPARHQRSDSALLWDAVRVMTRLLCRADVL